MRSHKQFYCQNLLPIESLKKISSSAWYGGTMFKIRWSSLYR